MQASVLDPLKASQSTTVPSSLREGAQTRGKEGPPQRQALLPHGNPLSAQTPSPAR